MKRGQKHPGWKWSEARPYMAGRSAMRARDTLIALRDLIDEAVKDIDKYEKLDKT